jgi:hypothetical protein
MRGHRLITAVTAISAQKASIHRLYRTSRILRRMVPSIIAYAATTTATEELIHTLIKTVNAVRYTMISSRLKEPRSFSHSFRIPISLSFAFFLSSFQLKYRFFRILSNKVLYMILAKSKDTLNSCLFLWFNSVFQFIF